MPENVEANGAEVSDAMSENEYDEIDHPIKEDEDESMAEQHTSPETGGAGSSEVKKKYDPKDPHRPRRKKARRACYACQRAHLTCGDERPCQRCIKRGLADACQDGVRKKAKYLHDAPPEALRPVLGPTFNPTMVSKSANGRHPSNATSASDASAYYSQSSTSQTYPIFTSGQPQVSMPDSIFGQPSPVSPSFQQSSQRAQQMGNMQIPTPSSEISSYPNALFDPSNPAIFNFDLEGLNFGSHYGAMEFGILGHMSSGAAETPPRDPSISQQAGTDVNFNGGQMYSNGMNQYNQIYDGMMESYMNPEHNNNSSNSNNNNMYSQGNLQHGLPHAYAIAAAGPTPSSLASPGTDNTSSPQPTNIGFEGSPRANNFTPANSQPIAVPPKSKNKTPANANAKLFGPQSILAKRQRDPSAIYENVKEPYQYLTGFHNLIALVKRRFSSTKTLRIAKSLASIRPSFISCTRNLNRQDLIFMEKCLQRTLFEYEDFMGHCSAPTVVCRRTGEVAAVNKEFIALTGWTKDILLGKSPNLNVNFGDTSGSVSGVNSGKGGLNTPQLKAMEPAKTTDDKPQPVFVAELMDDDSVIQFYEDFAQLAFGDSRGHVTRKCRLLKYRTKEAIESLSNEESPPQKDPRHSILSNRVTRIDGEHGISKIEKDGKMDCTYCWTIKRDVFDIPMLIVMNVSQQPIGY
ncbi:putative Zn(2)-C6 fungal-type domain-containing protein [Seiridium unicorne]|uniref:Zn(2)-C6 fungal-type domain-containing protein n=1 Tax=Seiridium unicorne TaxID=138068 RepID=A0ABR2VEX3_9PEZI